MRKTKPFSTLIKDQIYGRQTLFILGNDVEFAKKAFKKSFNQDAPKSLIEFYNDNATSFGRTIYNGVVVILVRNVDTGVICHEAFHAVEFHFKAIGLPLGDKSSEAWAYYLQFMVKEITSRIVIK